MEDPGLRWAPATLLRHQNLAFSTYKSGHLNENGFAVIKDCVEILGRFRFLNQTDDPAIYHIAIDSEPAVAFFVVEPHDHQSFVIEKALIVMQLPESRFDETSLGLLLSVYGEVGDCLLGHFVALLRLVRHSYTERSPCNHWREAREVYHVAGQSLQHQRIRID